MEDDKLRAALYKRALGFESDEIIEEYSADENGKCVLVKRRITKKYNPPDVSALKLLTLQEEFNFEDIANMTDQQLAIEKQRLLKLLFEEEMKNENGNSQDSA